MSDERRRELERAAATGDREARLRLLREKDRSLAPELRERVDSFGESLAEIIANVDEGAHVRVPDLARAVLAIDEAPDREGVRWTWVETFALVVLEAGTLTVGVTRRQGLWTDHFFAERGAEDDEGSDQGARTRLLGPQSSPLAFVSWARFPSTRNVREQREIVELWASRHAG